MKKGYGFHDRKSAYRLGPDMVTNGAFDTDTVGWASTGSATLSYSAGKAEVNISGGGGGIAKNQTWALTPGKTYLVSFEVSAGSYVGVFESRVGGVVQATGFIVPGSHSYTFAAPSADPSFTIQRATAATGTVYFDNISIREVYPR